MSFRVFTAACLITLVSIVDAQALDYSKYEKLTSDTVRELVSGKIGDPAATLDRLKQVMSLGVEGCREYVAKKPEDAPLINLVIAQAPAMLAMKPEDLEESWGDEGSAGDALGKPLKGYDQFSLTRNYLDIVVHPARAYDFVKAFQATGDAENLEQAKGELIEVLEHIKKIKAAS